MIEVLYTELQFWSIGIRWNNLHYTHQKPVFRQLTVIVLSFYEEFLQFHFARGNFCMISFMQVVILSQNFSQL
jgi:hypothetical protein